MAAVADLVYADANQALQAGVVKPLGADALDDRADGPPPDPEQPRDRREGHLLRQPRDGVFEVARVRRPGPSPRHRLQADPATAAAQPAQLALDDAASATQIKVTPTLDAPIVDLKLAAGLPALRANPPAPPQTNGHDHPLGAEADIDHGRPGQTKQPVECAGDAHVALLCEPLTFKQRAASLRGRRRVDRHPRNLRELLDSPPTAQPRPGPRRSGRYFPPRSTGDPKEANRVRGTQHTPQ